MKFFLASGWIFLLGLLGPSPPTRVPAGTLKVSIQKSLPLLQASDATFIEKSRCVSCHNNSLTAITVAAVREAGIGVNEDIARQQVKAVAEYGESWRERLLQGISIPGGPDTVSYMLVGLHAANHGADPATDAMASFLLELQSPDGRWRIQANRPPIESSDVTVTATSLRALQFYGPKADRAAYENAVQSATAWLMLAQPKGTEESIFRILALNWAGASKAMIEASARQLVAQQLPDGGWAQLLHMQSDAYATGQALVALLEGAGLPADNRSIQRGIQYLLDTQLEDGSWHVKTRSTPIQPYFESGFPHGKDQWISIAATNWATQALALALRTEM
jgi:hypothetical protein